MARVDVLMPQMGESIAEGTLSKWLKKVGDAVKRDEPMFEISTDKVDAEIPAPVAGVLAEVLVREGETVAVQTVVARLETEVGAAVAAAPAPPPPPAGRVAPPAPKSVSAAPTPAPAPAAVAAAPKTSPTQTAAPASAAAPPAPVGNGAVETAEERLRRKSTPLVRKIAAEHNLDLSAIPGTGLAGRVTKSDVLGYLEAPATPAAPAAPSAPAAFAPAGQPAPAPARPAAPGAAPTGPGVEA